MKNTLHTRRRAGTACNRDRVSAVFIVIGVALFAAAPVLAQGFQWPWSEPEQRPVPREPVYRPAPQTLPPPAGQAGPDGGWSARSSICLQLEQRLVQETQGNSRAREQLPQIEADMRQFDRAYQVGQSQLERADCYDYFLFSKTLRRTRKCVDLGNQVEDARRRLGELQAQRQQITGASGRSYQDEIVRELARNGCGDAYSREARKRDNNPFSSLWQDEDGGSYGGGNQYGTLPFATYRTLCVRLCDGYYFPVSFSTLPNHFQRDADACQSQCAAPAELFYYQNPGGAVDQMVSITTNEPYTKLKSAFQYRKEYVAGCSCKQAEYVPQTPIPEDAAGKRAEAPPPAEAEQLPWKPR